MVKMVKKKYNVRISKTMCLGRNCRTNCMDLNLKATPFESNSVQISPSRNKENELSGPN